MKKKYLLIVLLFQFGLLKAQDKDENASRVGSWTTATHNCFNGLEWKFRKSYYSDNQNKFINDVEIKNNYAKAVTFNFEVTADKNAKTLGIRKKLNSGESLKIKKCKNAEVVYLLIEAVCFDIDNCNKNCYALCDNGLPNVISCESGEAIKTNNQNTPSVGSKNTEDQLITTQNIKTTTNNSQSSQIVSAASAKIVDATQQPTTVINQTANPADIVQGENTTKEVKITLAEQKLLDQEKLQQENAKKIAKTPFEREEHWKTALKNANLKTPEGYQKAIELMLPYAIEDHLKGIALNEVGFWYQKLKDYENAVKWYNKAYLVGDVSAAKNLGTVYSNGLGVKVNKGMALTCFQKACELGNEKSCNDLMIVKNQLERMIASGENKNYDDFCAVAESHYIEKNYTEAYRYYLQAYEVTDLKIWSIALKIADMYYKEEELNSKKLAATWYDRAIMLMENDLKHSKDFGKGKTNTFDEKYTKALLHFANSIKEKEGRKAIVNYFKAIRDDIFEANSGIGLIYEQGLGGVEKDWNLAKNYYEKDAQKNVAKAMQSLGKLYDKGGFNLPMDKLISKKWFKKACETDPKYCK